jgi:hypothetical protein
VGRSSRHASISAKFEGEPRQSMDVCPLAFPCLQAGPETSNICVGARHFQSQKPVMCSDEMIF